MVNRIKQIIGFGAPARRAYSYAHVTRPEPPLGFVSRSDPNFYFLSKR
jgi:hypothetical protein